jgi:hypothetical protein
LRIKVIACEVLFREVCWCAARAKATVDLVFLRRGLHSNPDTLRAAVQEEVDRAEEGQCEAVALGYALCSNGVAGLQAKGVPLVAPRAHDCITLLLGSKERYAKEFAGRPGTYYYSGGWIERGADQVPRSPEDGAGLDVPFEELVRKYGQDNAEYLWEIQSGWVRNYTHAVFIDMGLGNTEQYRAYTRREAEQRGWSYGEMTGDLSLVQALVDGDWDEERFVVTRPGERIVACVGEGIMAVEEG